MSQEHPENSKGDRRERKQQSRRSAQKKHGRRLAEVVRNALRRRGLTS